MVKDLTDDYRACSDFTKRKVSHFR